MVATNTANTLERFGAFKELDLGGALAGLTGVTTDAEIELMAAKAAALNGLTADDRQRFGERIERASSLADLAQIVHDVAQQTQLTTLTHAGFRESAEARESFFERQNNLSARFTATMDSISETYASLGLEEPEYIRRAREEQARINQAMTDLENEVGLSAEDRQARLVDLARDHAANTRSVHVGAQGDDRLSDDQKDAARADYDAAISSFLDTVRDHARFKNPNATDEEIEAAVSAAHLTLMIELEADQTDIYTAEAVAHVNVAHQIVEADYTSDRWNAGFDAVGAEMAARQARGDTVEQEPALLVEEDGVQPERESFVSEVPAQDDQTVLATAEVQLQNQALFQVADATDAPSQTGLPVVSTGINIGLS